MMDHDHGVWWFVSADGDRIRISHGPTIDGLPQSPAASIGVGLDAALELAVGIVHAALAVDPDRTQSAMLQLWLRDVE